MYIYVILVNLMSNSEGKNFVAGLFRRYELNIRKFLMRKSSQKEDVEDIVQETFLKAHKVADWENVKNPEAYLVSIAKNTYRDHIRKETRNAADNMVDASLYEIKDDAPTPEQFAEGRQNIAKLETVINSLTPRVKQAIILIKILDVSYAEASEIMNVSVSTIENHVAKGMSVCRGKIQIQAIYSGQSFQGNKVISFSDHKKSGNKKNRSKG